MAGLGELTMLQGCHCCEKVFLREKAPCSSVRGGEGEGGRESKRDKGDSSLTAYCN